MKIQDILANIFTLDKEKEYEIVEKNNSNINNSMDINTDSSVNSSFNSRSGSIVTVDTREYNAGLDNVNDYKQQIEDLQKRNSALEEANRRLFNQIPIGQPEKTFEENIIELVKGDLYHGNGKTSAGTSS